MTVHCACGDDKCEQAISIHGYNRTLYIYNQEGKEAMMMYIDGNFLIALMIEAREALRDMAQHAGESSCGI